MKQIQEEEEKRKAKLAQAKAQAQAQVTSSNPGAAPSANTKRGYADLAATSAPSSGSGWQTVGAKAVPGAAAPAPAARPAAPVKSAAVAPPKPVAPSPAVRAVKANGGSFDDSTPSVEFVRWAKQSLNGLNVNSKLDEYVHYEEANIQSTNLSRCCSPSLLTLLNLNELVNWKSSLIQSTPIRLP